MNTTTTSNTTNWRAIESALLNKIAVRGVTSVAATVGVHKSQVSRWKEVFIPKMARLLAALDWGVDDQEIAELARRVAAVLTKAKTPDAATSGAL